jgi:hypothetical protein
MVQHAVHRGLDEPLLTDAETSPLYGSRVREGQLRSPSYADLGQIRLAEGGRPALRTSTRVGSRARSRVATATRAVARPGPTPTLPPAQVR